MTLNASPVFLTFNNVYSSFFSRIFFILLLSSISLLSLGQTSEVKKDTLPTIPEKKGKSPTKAMIFSAVVPGLGQAYNKKYWKIPIIYAGIGTTLYFFDSNNKIYKEYKQAYINKTDTATSTIDIYPAYSETQLLEYENQYRRYRDMNAMLIVLFYSINIVDAYVDAHLSTFDVSDNLTLHVAPSMNFYSSKNKPAMGLTLSLGF